MAGGHAFPLASLYCKLFIYDCDLPASSGIVTCSMAVAGQGVHPSATAWQEGVLLDQELGFSCWGWKGRCFWNNGTCPSAF